MIAGKAFYIIEENEKMKNPLFGIILLAFYKYMALLLKEYIRLLITKSTNYEIVESLSNECNNILE